MPALRSASLIALLLTAAANTLFAQTVVPKLEEEGPRGEFARKLKEKAVAQFDQADTDKDGKLSKEEVAKISSHKAENFEKLDLNKDGFLSWEEFVGHNRWSK